MLTAELLWPDVALIAFGWVLCHRTALTRPTWQAVELLVYYVLYPVLLFNAIVQSSWEPAATARLALTAVAVVTAGIGLTLALSRWPGIDARRLASGAQTAFRFNSFVGLAMAERMGGAQSLGWMALCVGLCVPLVNMAAVWTLARDGGHAYGRALLSNPLVLGTAAGLLVHALGATFPEPVTATLRRLAVAALPLGLMATGAGLRGGPLRDAPGLGATLMLVRHAVLPALALTISLACSLAPAQRAVAVLFAALPTSSSTYVLAARMGGDGAYVAALVTASTLLAMLGIPLWLTLSAALG